MTEFNVKKINKKYRNMYDDMLAQYLWPEKHLKFQNFYDQVSNKHAKFIFHSYVFHLFSGCKSKSFNCGFNNLYKHTFLTLVAPSTQILLIMILHFCYLENWKTRLGCTYLRISNKKGFQKFNKFDFSSLVSAIVVQNNGYCLL